MFELDHLYSKARPRKLLNMFADMTYEQSGAVPPRRSAVARTVAIVLARRCDRTLRHATQFTTNSMRAAFSLCPFWELAKGTD
jgi:hypothetical protein